MKVAAVARWWLSALLALPLSVAAQPACIPAPFGTGTGFVIKSDDKARAFGWWCPSPYEPPKPVIYSGTLSSFVPDWESIAYALARGTPSEWAAAHNKYATQKFERDSQGRMLIPQDQWPTFKAVRDSLLVSRPPDPIWRVAPNSGYPTRPAFAYKDGKRATTPTARATVDATCYCDTRDIVGSTVYCAVNQERTWMTICTKRN
jgi:hypothetical protein